MCFSVIQWWKNVDNWLLRQSSQLSRESHISYSVPQMPYCHSAVPCCDQVVLFDVCDLQAAFCQLTVNLRRELPLILVLCQRRRQNLSSPPHSAPMCSQRLVTSSLNLSQSGCQVLIIAPCSFCIFNLSSVVYFPAWINVNVTVYPNCADVLLRTYSLPE